jgi:hypothetical protein
MNKMIMVKYTEKCRMKGDINDVLKTLTVGPQNEIMWLTSN